jgi:hypothetical protein
MSGNQTRVLTDWTVKAITAPEETSLAVMSAASVPLDIDNPQCLISGKAPRRRSPQ